MFWVYDWQTYRISHTTKERASLFTVLKAIISCNLDLQCVRLECWRKAICTLRKWCDIRETRDISLIPLCPRSLDWVVDSCRPTWGYLTVDYNIYRDFSYNVLPSGRRHFISMQSGILINLKILKYWFCCILTYTKQWIIHFVIFLFTTNFALHTLQC